MKTYKVNEELAGLVPMAVPSEQIALNNDIASNGLNQPIVLWRDEIVDGRCRQIACVQANVEIATVSIPWATPIADVITKVKSLNTRRNLTLTQKTMVAVKEYYKSSGNQATVAKEWGIGLKALKSGIYILKHNEAFADILFDGGKVQVMVQRGFGPLVEIETDKLATIAKAIKLEKERDKLIIDDSEQLEWNPDSQIKTEAGKQWYTETIEDAERSMVSYMIELANYKFRLSSDTSNEG